VEINTDLEVGTGEIESTRRFLEGVCTVDVSVKGASRAPKEVGGNPKAPSQRGTFEVVLLAQHRRQMGSRVLLLFEHLQHHGAAVNKLQEVFADKGRACGAVPTWFLHETTRPSFRFYTPLWRLTITALTKLIRKDYALIFNAANQHEFDVKYLTRTCFPSAAKELLGVQSLFQQSFQRYSAHLLSHECRAGAALVPADGPGGPGGPGEFEFRPCSCSWSKNPCAGFQAELLRSAQQPECRYADRYVDVFNPKAVSHVALTRTLEEMAWGLTIGTEQPVTVHHFVAQAVEQGGAGGAAIMAGKQSEVRCGTLPLCALWASPAHADPQGAGDPMSTSTNNLLRALVTNEHDKRLVALSLSAWNSSSSSSPDLELCRGRVRGTTASTARIALLKRCSWPLRLALLMRALGVCVGDEGDGCDSEAAEEDVLRVHATAAGAATPEPAGDALKEEEEEEDEEDVKEGEAALVECSPLPLSLVLPVASLRFWIKESARLGDPVSDAEVHAAIAGLCTRLEPVLAAGASSCYGSRRGDPMLRMLRQVEEEQKRAEAEADGVGVPLSGAAGGGTAAAPLLKRGTEPATGAASKACILDRRPTIVEVVGRVDGLQKGEHGSLGRYVDALRAEGRYPVKLLNQGGRTVTLDGADLKRVHLKPDWVTPTGLRRLAQWTDVLSRVEQLSRALQLQLPSWLAASVDSVDFLFNHWTAMHCMGGTPVWEGGDISEGSPHAYETATRTAIHWLQRRCEDSGRVDPVRESIKRRCSGPPTTRVAPPPAPATETAPATAAPPTAATAALVTAATAAPVAPPAPPPATAAADRLLKLFDALLAAATPAGSHIAGMVGTRTTRHRLETTRDTDGSSSRLELQLLTSALARFQTEDSDEDWEAAWCTDSDDNDDNDNNDDDANVGGGSEGDGASQGGGGADSKGHTRQVGDDVVCGGAATRGSAVAMDVCSAFSDVVTALGVVAEDDTQDASNGSHAVAWERVRMLASLPRSELHLALPALLRRRSQAQAGVSSGLDSALQSLASFAEDGCEGPAEVCTSLGYQQTKEHAMENEALGLFETLVQEALQPQSDN
jgi:hypothetical protein